MKNIDEDLLIVKFIQRLKMGMKLGFILMALLLIRNAVIAWVHGLAQGGSINLTDAQSSLVDAALLWWVWPLFFFIGWIEFTKKAAPKDG